MEYIICKAIHWPTNHDVHKWAHLPSNLTKGFITTGSTYHECITNASAITTVLANYQDPPIPKGLRDDWGSWHYGLLPQRTEGYLTSEGRFISGAEAEAQEDVERRRAQEWHRKYLEERDKGQ